MSAGLITLFGFFCLLRFPVTLVIGFILKFIKENPDDLDQIFSEQGDRELEKYMVSVIMGLTIQQIQFLRMEITFGIATFFFASLVIAADASLHILNHL